MTTSAKVQAEKTTSVIVTLIGLAMWWVVFPLFSSFERDGWVLMFVGVPALGIAIGLLTACRLLRKNKLIFLIWFPLTALTCILVETFGKGALAELPFVRTSVAPLEGVAFLLIAAVAITASIILALCVLWYPKQYSATVCVLTIVNTLAIAFTVWNHNEQMLTVEILDSKNQPITGVEVHYEVYGYGPGGNRPSSPEIKGGPIYSGSDGIVNLRSRNLRHEVDAFFTKAGFETVKANLGMQYNEYDSQRELDISIGDVGRLTSGFIPSSEPVKFIIYLPKMNEGPQPLLHYQPNTTITKQAPSKRYLSLSTGGFTSDINAGDVRFDFVEYMDDQGHKRYRLRVTGINGVTVMQVPYFLALSVPPSPFEYVMQIAPAHGYSESTVIDEPGNQPGPTIYIRAREGERYAKLTLSGDGGRSDADIEGTIDQSDLFVNPTGSRQLLFDPQLQDPPTESSSLAPGTPLER